MHCERDALTMPQCKNEHTISKGKFKMYNILRRNIFFEKAASFNFILPFPEDVTLKAGRAFTDF